jgi:hypothetical protein
VAILGLAACSGVALAALQGIDVGGPAMPGSFTVSGNQVTVIGGGADIWGGSDNFYYAYMPISGDFDYTMQVISLLGNSGDGGWTKVELMARYDDQGFGNPANGADPFIANMTTRLPGDTTGGAPATSGIDGPQIRTVDAGNADQVAPSPAVPSNIPNQWVRLERVGSVFYMYYSHDGTNWTMYNAPQGFDTAGSWPAGGDNGTTFTNAWPNAIYLGIAVTAHSDPNTSTSVVQNFGPWVPKPVAITQQMPATLSVAADSPALSLAIGATGDPVHYKWSKSGTAISRAVGSTFTSTNAFVTASDAGTYTVQVFGGGQTITSSACVVTVTADTTPPTIAKASSDSSFTAVVVKFSEPVDATALTASNYKLDHSMTVSSVSRTDVQTVTLTTSKLATDGTTYTLTVNGVKDLAGNTIATDSTYQFMSWKFMSGGILHKYWNNITAGNTNGLWNDARYPNNPTMTTLEPMFEFPPAGGNGYADAYGNTLECYFIPPSNGNYVFFTCSDDQSWLFLSTDSNPANMLLIAEEQGWSNSRQWVAAGSGDVTAKRSDQFSGSMWATPNVITLQAGKQYYLFDSHYEGGGGDDVGATYKLDSEADPANGDAPRLTGSVVGYYFDPTGASVTFVTQPANETAIQGTNATFTGAATGTSAYGTTVSYQWQSQPSGSSTWTSIAGATAATYQTGLLKLTDSLTKFQLLVTVPTLTATSQVATLTVIPDTTPPVVFVGAMNDATAGVVDVGVAFNKPVDDVSGQVLANYSVSPGTITGITWYTNCFYPDSQKPTAMIKKQNAMLKVTGLSGSGTLTVKNVADTLGNKLSATGTNVAFTVDTTMKWGVVGANSLGGVNGVVAVAPGGFDVYSDGVGEWGTTDETTFVYQAVTGDFDKKLRVEYQDNSSQWARAGIIMREDLTVLGMDIATQGTECGRYQKCHVNPVGPTLTGPGTAGNQSWEGNRRLDVGGASTTALTGVNSIPQYPNAWCRIQRVGQVFTIFRSDDGVNWVNLGKTTWGVDDVALKPMPATVYVGPEFTPENGNCTADATSGWSNQGSFMARFRDYGDYVAVTNPNLTVSVDATGKVTISWAAGTLVSSSTVHGTYAPVTGATSPLVITPTAGGTMFYQVKQ